MRRVLNLVVLLALTLGPWLGAAPASTLAAPDTPTDIPATLVPAGNVASYTLAAPKLFYNNGVPICPPRGPNQDPQAVNTYPETVSRIATYGSTIRTIYSNQVNCGAGQILSNVVSDGSYVYWLTANGLYRTSVNANPGDAPQLVNALLVGPGELAMGSDKVFAFYTDPFSPSPKIGYVTLTPGQTFSLIPLTAPGAANNLQTDGTWVYYLVGTNLYRLKPGVDIGVLIATGVSGYFPEGTRLTGCLPQICFFSNFVYLAKGATLYHYDNNASSNPLGSAIYTSGDASAWITQIVTDSTRAFFVERRDVTCPSPPCFISYTYVLNRITRSGTNLAALYTTGVSIYNGLGHLTTDGSYLFFTYEDGSLLRLANDASVLPSINLSVTGMEVTQGIQNTSNSVLLVNKKRTFVRVYVKSAGAPVPGVTAQLDAPDLAGEPSLAPVNPVGSNITVRATPDRNDINQSFLFELPWKWTQYASLHLRVTVNPYKVPLEPNYTDDISNVTVAFVPSPSLSVEFFRLNYTLGGKTYTPRVFDDIQKTYSWILRAYPIGGPLGTYFKPRIWDVAGGTQLGKWVNTSDPDCKDVYGGPNDDISLCASYFTNGWLYYYRQATSNGDLNVGLNPTAFYYGMISDAAGFFPRGQAMYAQTSVGPAGIPGSGSWDTDGSYADWYAAHEIGHSLGRAHPNAGSDNPATSGVYENCGHSRSDPGFPYGNLTTSRAPIGPSNNSMEGFDVGDPTFGIKMAVLPSATWNDVMSYCSNQWISDYTYSGMWAYMITHPSAPASDQPAMAALNGNFLVVVGSINTNTNKAGFSLVRRATSVASQPNYTSGAYVLRLLNGSDVELGTDQFISTSPVESPGMLEFGHTLTFLPGTRKLELVRVSDGAVLATTLISANAPTVSNVALAQGSPNPVSGTVTLNWSANDSDGDPLTFDVFYSRDNGVTFQPIVTSLSAATTPIDTSSLGGSGSAILRVIASDGANTGQADSAAFVMAAKPPQPAIETPLNNLHIHYGQLVNFSGTAMDAQDGWVADAGLTWLDSLNGAANVAIGNGALFSSTNLPVGSNLITLQATNSKGISAHTSVTVIVDDSLDLPGPTLSAGPSQVGWQVVAGTNTLQTAAISITNTGSGDLPWTASANAAWLHLDVTSGTVSAGAEASVMNLSADPSGLAEGTQRNALVTISAAGQTVQIPVSLSVGDIYLVSNTAPSFQPIYLPLIER